MKKDTSKNVEGYRLGIILNGIEYLVERGCVYRVHHSNPYSKDGVRLQDGYEKEQANAIREMEDDEEAYGALAELWRECCDRYNEQHLV